MCVCARARVLGAKDTATNRVAKGSHWQRHRAAFRREAGAQRTRQAALMREDSENGNSLNSGLHEGRGRPDRGLLPHSAAHILLLSPKVRGLHTLHASSQGIVSRTVIGARDVAYFSSSKRKNRQ